MPDAGERARGAAAARGKARLHAVRQGSGGRGGAIAELDGPRHMTNTALARAVFLESVGHGHLGLVRVR